MGQDSQPGRRLGSYACRSTLLQLVVIGEGINISLPYFDTQGVMLHNFVGQTSKTNYVSFLFTGTGKKAGYTAARRVYCGPLSRTQRVQD
jgi:hypothetical protein